MYELYTIFCAWLTDKLKTDEGNHIFLYTPENPITCNTSLHVLYFCCNEVNIMMICQIILNISKLNYFQWFPAIHAFQTVDITSPLNTNSQSLVPNIYNNQYYQILWMHKPLWCTKLPLDVHVHLPKHAPNFSHQNIINRTFNVT